MDFRLDWTDVDPDTADLQRRAMAGARSMIREEQDYWRVAHATIGTYGAQAAEETTKLADIFGEWDGAEDCEQIWRRVTATINELLRCGVLHCGRPN